MHKPDTARARPSTLLEDNTSYEKLYNPSNNINAYYITALIGKKAEQYLKTQTDLSASDKNNLRFYLAFVMAVLLTKNKYPGFGSLDNINPQEINTENFESCFNLIIERYIKLGGNDRLAKGQVFIKDIKTKLDAFLEEFVSPNK